MVVVIEQAVKQDQSLKRTGGWVRDRIGTKLCVFSVVCCRCLTVLSTGARCDQSRRVCMPITVVAQGVAVNVQHYADIGKQELPQLLYQLSSTRPKPSGNFRLASCPAWGVRHPSRFSSRRKKQIPRALTKPSIFEQSRPSFQILRPHAQYPPECIGICPVWGMHFPLASGSELDIFSGLWPARSNLSACGQLHSAPYKTTIL